MYTIELSSFNIERLRSFISNLLVWPQLSTIPVLLWLPQLSTIPVVLWLDVLSNCEVLSTVPQLQFSGGHHRSWGESTEMTVGRRRIDYRRQHRCPSVFHSTLPCSCTCPLWARLAQVDCVCLLPGWLSTCMSTQFIRYYITIHPRRLLQQHPSPRSWLHLQFQSVLINSARLITKSDSFTVTLQHDIPWLLVHQRIQYKLSTCLQMFAAYGSIISLCDVCPSVNWLLWSAANGTLPIPCTTTRGCGPHSFAVYGPRCGNAPSSALKSLSLSIRHFCCQLKTVLFRYGYAQLQPS